MLKGGREYNKVKIKPPPCNIFLTKYILENGGV